jgi:ABC-type nitrate/sulfonate/bicarbonate transport system substrate-binding protein
VAKPERATVTVALDWVPNTNHTGIFVAQQQGWYDEENLDVRLLPYVSGSEPSVLVAAGKADFGIGFEESLTMARAAKQPIVSLAAIIQHNTSVFVTLKDSGLDRPAKLAGKRYAGFGSPFEDPIIDRMITCDGGTNGQVQNITTDTGGLDAVLAKQADFVWVFEGWESIIAKRQGIELNSFSPTQYCVPDYYTPLIVTSEQTIQQKPDVVRRFMRATSRGYEFAVSNPDLAADLLVKGAPAGTFEDPGLVTDSARYLATKYKEGKSRWGEQDLSVWTNYPKFMIQTGKVVDENGNPVTGDLDYAAMFTNAFLP